MAGYRFLGWQDLWLVCQECTNTRRPAFHLYSDAASADLYVCELCYHALVGLMSPERRPE